MLQVQAPTHRFEAMAKRQRDSGVSDEDLIMQESLSSQSHSEESAAHTPKYASLEPAEAASSPSTMRCNLPPHKPLSFPSYGEYETHYQKDHTNRCLECSRNFPTGHFLELHIAENHDPITASKREMDEKTYACFVEDCDKVCIDWKKRRSHLVDKHGYPKNYDFLVVDHGIDGRRNMLRAGIDSKGHRKSSRERGRNGSSATTATTGSTEATSVSESTGDHVRSKPAEGEGGGEKEGAMDDLTNSMSALKMVPRSITFGRRKGNMGFSKK